MTPMIRVIINTYDQLRAAVESKLISPKQAVAISYTPPTSHSTHGRTTHIYSPFFATNPLAAWYDNDKKAFVGNKKESMPLAIAWATQEYKIIDWKRNRFGDMVPAQVQIMFPIPKRQEKK